MVGAVLGLAAFVAPAVSGVVAQKAPVTPRSIDRADAAADLRSWLQRVEQVHPSRPHTRRLRAEVAQAIRALPPRMTVFELWERLSILAATVEDTHTFVLPPDGKGRVSLPVVVREDGVFLRRELGELPAGSRLERIGELSVDDLLGRSLPWACATSEAGTRWAQASLLPVALTASGVQPPFDVVAVDDAGTVHRASIETVEVPARRNAMDVRVLPGSVVYFAIRTFAGPREHYFEWFDSVFRQLRGSSVRGLVVDLRGNAGGDTAIGAMLLSYVTDRPHRVFGAKLWRVSAQMQRYVREVGIDVTDYERADVGVVLRQIPPVAAPPEQPARFAGPTVFLIDAGTRSAAMMTANAVEDFELGLLVGEPTSESPRFFGEGYRFTLKHSQLSAMSSTAAFVRADGDPARGGPVQPHLLAPTTPRDLTAGHDAALDTALAAVEAFHTMFGGAGEGANPAASR